jgi:hypothetical protein
VAENSLNNMTNIHDRAKCLCDEFSDWVLYDDVNRSVIFNTSEEYLFILDTELLKIGYIEIHFSELEISDGVFSYTCVYKHR